MNPVRNLGWTKALLAAVALAPLAAPAANAIVGVEPPVAGTENPADQLFHCSGPDVSVGLYASANNAEADVVRQRYGLFLPDGGSYTSKEKTVYPYTMWGSIHEDFEYCVLLVST